jgi:hypothetical protein
MNLTLEQRGTASIVLSISGSLLLGSSVWLGLIRGALSIWMLSVCLFPLLQLGAFILGVTAFPTLRGKIGFFLSLFQGLIYLVLFFFLVRNMHS